MSVWLYPLICIPVWIAIMAWSNFIPQRILETHRQWDWEWLLRQLALNLFAEMIATQDFLLDLLRCILAIALSVLLVLDRGSRVYVNQTSAFIIELLQNL
jgi:hypothetical protein